TDKGRPQPLLTKSGFCSSSAHDHPELARSRAVHHGNAAPPPPGAARRATAAGPEPPPDGAPPACSTSTAVTPVRRAIESQSVRLSASESRPPRRSNHGQTILRPI